MAGILLLGSSPAAAPSGFSQRSVINVNFFASNMYATINHYVQGSSTTSPVGATFATTTAPYGGLIDANGWPNDDAASGHAFGGGWGLPGADEFTGPYCFQWDGDGTVVFDNTGSVWTEANYVPPGGVSFVNGNPDITWANTFSAGQIVIFDTTVAGFTAWTKYYVIAAGLTTSKIRVSATLGGTAITPNANGSSSLFGPYTKFGGNGGWTNTRGCNGSDMKVIASVSGTTGPQSPNVNVQSTNIYSLGLFVKNIKIYRQADEADLLAGKVFRTGWKQPLVDLNPSAIRFMVWEDGGIPPCGCRFENRGLPLTSGWNGSGGNTNDFISSPVYASNLSGTNALTLAAATPTASNPKTTPVADFHGEVVTCRMTAANNSVQCGQRLINAISNAANAQVTVNLRKTKTPTSAVWSAGSPNIVTLNLGGSTPADGHGIAVGTVTKLLLSGFTPSALNGTQTCTAINPNNLTFSLVSNPGATTVIGTWQEGHGYAVGQKVVHILNTAIVSQGMYRLHYFPCTIVSLVDAFAYTINVDTSGYGAFTPVSTQDFSCQFLTLSVNGRNAYHIMQPDGGQPEGYQAGEPNPANPTTTGGLNYIDSQTGNVSFFFDKTCSAETDGTAATFTGSISGTTLTVSSVSGVIAIGHTLGADTGGVAGGTIITGGSGTTWTVNKSQATSSRAMNSVGWIYGVWLWKYGSNSGMVPLEICTAMINEINDMSIAQGISGLVGMWVVAPIRALMVTDPDYTTASDWGLGIADVVTNPSSTLRYSGYSNLTHNAKLYIELGNEVWNLTFLHAYVARRQQLRWPGTGGSPTDMQAFMSTTMMKTIKAAYPTNQIRCVLAGWAIGGAHSAGLIDNFQLINGSNTLIGGTIANSPGYSYTNDPYVVSNSYGTPISNHDCFAIAPYFDPAGAYAGDLIRADFTSGSPNVTIFGYLPQINQKIQFTAQGSGLPSNVTAGTVYKVSSVTGTVGAASTIIQFSTLGGTLITPNANAAAQSINMTGQGTFLDDSAMYNGTDNTSNNGGNYTGAANTSAAITSFVNDLVLRSQGGIYAYCDNAGAGIVSGFTAVLNPLSKPLINYEGGFDWACDISVPGNGVTYFNGTVQINSAMAAFLTAVYQSTQWRDAQLGYFNNCASFVPGTAMQGIFVNIGVGTRRWSYAYPDSYSGTTEGGAFANNPTWVGMGSRNRALSV